MTLDFEDFCNSFDDHTIDKGLRVFQADKVLNLAISDQGILRGSVRGSGRQTYRQTIRVSTVTNSAKTSTRNTRLHGLCSCPVGIDCKHCTAVMFEYFARLEYEQSKAGRSAPATSRQHIHTHHDDEFELWLAKLSDQQARSSGTLANKAPDRLVYLLSRNHRTLTLSLSIEIRPVLKNGQFSTRTKRSFDLSRYFRQGVSSTYMEPADRLVLSHILANGQQSMYEMSHPLVGDLVVDTLKLLIRTGRAFNDPRQTLNNKLEPLFWAGARPLQLQWSKTVSGGFRLEPHADELEIINLVPPLYFNAAKSQIGELESPLKPEVLKHIHLMPELAVDQLGKASQRLQESLGRILPMVSAQAVQSIESAMQPTLHFGKASFRPRMSKQVSHAIQLLPKTLGQSDKPSPALLDSNEFCYIRPSFGYGLLSLEALSDDMLINIDKGISYVEQTIWLDDQCFKVRRDLKAEAAVLDEMKRTGLRPLSAHELSSTDETMRQVLSFDLIHDDTPWIKLITAVVPTWQTMDWRLEYADDFPFVDVMLADDEDVWFQTLDPGDDNDLFLGIGIEINGQHYNLLPCLLKLMSDYTPATLAQLSDDSVLPVGVDDGNTLYLPIERIRTLVGGLYGLFDYNARKDDTRLQIRPEDMVLLDDLALETRHHDSILKLRQMIDQLRRPALGDAIVLPETFKASLRGYQAEGVHWLQLLRETGNGGILADDMGLGKTIQTLAHLCLEQCGGRLDKPALLIVTTSLITNWRSEAARFAPSLRVLILHGPDRRTNFTHISKHDLVITTYPLVLRDADILMTSDYSLLILDEAQAIKNPRSKVTQLLNQFEARQRLCLTGTPLENHLGELWSQFHFLNPGLLKDQSSFNRLYRIPIERHGDHRRQRALHARIAPFMLRRTKVEVATELPPKTVMVRRAVLKPRQRDLYETVRIAMDKKVRKLIAQKGLKRSQIEILDALLKLRQICCDPALLKMKAAQDLNESAKLDLLKTLLPELLDEGRRVLIFSQFTSMLSRIETYLKSVQITYVKLTGATRDRATPLQRFQNEEVPVFLISLKAGGTGLNLTAADTVIHFDPWWNPAVEDQATDRAYRIGQDKPVFVYRLIVEDSVEEKMLDLQEKKRALAESVYDGTGKPGYGFDEADLAELFS